MTEIEKPLTLRDRPKSRDLIWLKWVAALSGVFAVAFISLSLIAQFYYFTMPGEGDTPKELFVSSLYETSASAGIYLFVVTVTAALLWLGSKATDRLDLLVWLKANNEDRKEIISLRDKNAKNK